MRRPARLSSSSFPLGRAGVLSLVAHGALLALIAVQAAGGPDLVVDLLATPPDPAGSPAALLPEVETWVDLVPAPAEAPAPTFTPEPPAPTLQPPADETRLAAAALAARRGILSPAALPAPDSGLTWGGAAQPAAARRDRSTLHRRGDDGAETYQVERERVAARASSPQPIRQEPRIGLGDSARTRHPSRAPDVAPRPELPTDDEGDPDSAVLVQDPEPQPPGSTPEPARGDGPLDADQGTRRFDVEAVGVAQDTRWARAASDERHPGRLELSRPSASSALLGEPGHGPSDEPGAVSRASNGEAPALAGVARPVVLDPTAALAAGALEREYHRYQGEIRRRVASTLQFPPRLALMLEQGETVVRFVVRADGRLGGAVRVVKSAGFDEFDAEAVRAVTRAAPFPPMTCTLNVSMPIAFDNPVVR